MSVSITLIGAAILDILAGSVSTNIFQKGSLPMDNITLSFGGDALNEAVVLSQLGVEVELISKVGNDEAGKRILDFLKEKKVKTKIKIEEKLETGINIVLIDETGERNFLTNPNSSLRKLSEQDIMEHLEKAGDIVCMASLFVSSLLDIKTMERIFQKIKSKPERILVADITSPKNGERLADISCLLKYIDYIIPNETEAGRLTNETEAHLNAELFLEHGASCVIIKRGKQGCLLKTQTQEIEISAYQGTNAIDTTGAGDSFVAGFIYGLKNQMSIEECARFGCAVASCTIEKFGANTAIDSVELPMKRYWEMVQAERKNNYEGTQ